MKRILLACVVLFAAHASFAQQPHVEFGVKGGINLANFNDESNSNTDARTGFYAGGLAHIHLTRNWALQPELVFSAQGAEYGATKWKASYVNIPVLAQYMFGNGFRLQTGPQLGILAGSEVKTGNTETDLDDVFKTTDFSWSFGASYLTRSRLGVDARYNLGLSNINKNDNNPELKNRVWQLGLFYQFKH
jgi:hypothetical protein